MLVVTTQHRAVMSLSKEGKGSKWRGFYDSARKFKPEWQKSFHWVKIAVDGSDSAFCSFCKVNIYPKLVNLEQHEDSAKHKKATSSVFSNRKSPIVPRKDDAMLKKIDITFAVAMTCHCAIRSVDHFGEIVV